ncbi:hypothetical protein TNCV_4144901 [Trichonephila clavipes]|nr:hypothetical protein TNCV_4144901 [Trichonephila clavipes]
MERAKETILSLQHHGSEPIWGGMVFECGEAGYEEGQTAVRLFGKHFEDLSAPCVSHFRKAIHTQLIFMDDNSCSHKAQQTNDYLEVADNIY